MYSVFSCSALNPGTGGTFPEVVEAQPPQGTCNVSSATPNVITALTGSFQPQFSGKTITVNGTGYVFTYTDSTHGTLASGPGVLTGVNWSFATIPAEEVAQNQCVNDAGGAPTWESQSSSWQADVDTDATSGGNPLKLYSTTVIDPTGSQVTKNVMANDQGSPTSYAANVALETALTNASATGTGNVSSATPNVLTATAGTFLSSYEGKKVTINGVDYTFHFTDSTHGTLDSGPGSLTGITWTFRASGRICSRITKVDVKAN